MLSAGLARWLHTPSRKVQEVQGKGYGVSYRHQRVMEHFFMSENEFLEIITLSI